MSSTRECLDEIHRASLLLEASQRGTPEIAGLYDEYILAEILEEAAGCLLRSMEIDRCCGSNGDGIMEPGRVCGHCLKLDKEIAWSRMQQGLKWEASA